MGRTQIRIVDEQTEEIKDERQLTDEETRAFLFKNYPDLYKQMYPDQVIERSPEQQSSPANPNQVKHPIVQKPRNGQDIQKTDKVYIYNEYGDMVLSNDNSFSYKIEIKTDMKINRR